MTSKLTSDERLVKILSETQATIMEHNSRCVRGSVEVDARLFESMIMELQERRKAAMDGEPVAYIDKQWTLVYYIPPMSMGLKIGDKLYRHAQPAPDREQVRCEHAEWSQATFGDVGPVGPLKHLSKEALEAAAEPGDLSEWADMQFLLWDAQRRAGITDEQITKAMIEKLAVNKLRDWPEPKDGEPRLHIKEQPAPVVLKDHEIRELVNQLRDIAIKYHGTGQLRERIAHVIRGAMLQAGNSPCSGQLKLATALEFFQYRFSDSFGGNPPL